MVWPILISVSVAPGPYFFCAAAGFAASAAAIRAAADSRYQFFAIGFPPRKGQCPWLSRLVIRAGASDDARPGGSNETRYAARHQVHDGDEEDAVDRPRRRLRDLIGDIGDELDEER